MLPLPIIWGINYDAVYSTSIHNFRFPSAYNLESNYIGIFTESPVERRDENEFVCLKMTLGRKQVGFDLPLWVTRWLDIRSGSTQGQPAFLTYNSLINLALFSEHYDRCLGHCWSKQFIRPFIEQVFTVGQALC